MSVKIKVFTVFVLCSERYQWWEDAGMEIYLHIPCLSSHQVAAKIHRSFYIKFLHLTWHAVVNQPMKGKLICCSRSWCLCLLPKMFMFFNVTKCLDCHVSPSEFAEGRTTSVSVFFCFNSFILSFIMGGFPLWQTLSSYV